MQNPRAVLRMVIKRFPEHRSSLERLCEASTSFQSLCDDYDDCISALRYWQQSVSEEARYYRGEYTELLRELEEEISYYLENLEQAIGA